MDCLCHLFAHSQRNQKSKWTERRGKERNQEIALDLNSIMTSIVNVATSGGSQIWHNGVTSGGKALNFKILVSVASGVDDFNLNSGETSSVDSFCIVASVISEQLVADQH